MEAPTASQYGQTDHWSLTGSSHPFQNMLSIPMNFYFCSEIFFFFLRICTSPPPSSSAQSFLLQEGFLQSPRNMNFPLLSLYSFIIFITFVPVLSPSIHTHAHNKMLKEETEQTLSWKQDSILGRTGLWAICPVSMETTYQLENQGPRKKSPRALHP